MTAPHWTTDPPTVPGWYWIRLKLMNGEYDREPHVGQVFDRSGDLRLAYVRDERHDPIGQVDALWLGPIEPPEVKL